MRRDSIGESQRQGHPSHVPVGLLPPRQTPPRLTHSGERSSPERQGSFSPECTRASACHGLGWEMGTTETRGRPPCLLGACPGSLASQDTPAVGGARPAALGSGSDPAPVSSQGT